MSNWMLISALYIASSLAGAGNSRNFTGVITDSMCNLNHKMMRIAPDSKCVTDCVRSSKSFKYALHDGKNIYLLSDQQTPEKFAARKVRVKGVLYEKTGIIKVESIEAAE